MFTLFLRMYYLHHKCYKLSILCTWLLSRCCEWIMSAVYCTWMWKLPGCHRMHYLPKLLLWKLWRLSGLWLTHIKLSQMQFCNNYMLSLWIWICLINFQHSLLKVFRFSSKLWTLLNSKWLWNMYAGFLPWYKWRLPTMLDRLLILLGFNYMLKMHRILCWKWRELFFMWSRDDGLWQMFIQDSMYKLRKRILSEW